MGTNEIIKYLFGFSGMKFDIVGTTTKIVFYSISGYFLGKTGKTVDSNYHRSQ